jgi:hypothetical protein
VKYGNRNINTTVLGTTPNYPGVHGFEMAAGRMFTLADDSARKRVAVLAAEVPGMLDTDATGIIGRNVSIRSIPFEVIGVLEAKGSTGWRNPDDDVWIPLSTAQFRVTGNEFVERISVLVDQSSSIELAMLDIERVLRREHGILPGKDNDFAMINRKQFAESRQEATQVFTFLLAGIAGVSLVVGGIGIYTPAVPRRVHDPVPAGRCTRSPGRCDGSDAAEQARRVADGRNHRFGRHGLRLQCRRRDRFRHLAGTAGITARPDRCAAARVAVINLAKRRSDRMCSRKMHCHGFLYRATKNDQEDAARPVCSHDGDESCLQPFHSTRSCRCSGRRQRG